MHTHRLWAMFAAGCAAIAMLASARVWAIHVPEAAPIAAGIGLGQLLWVAAYALRPGRRLLDIGLMLAAGCVALWATLAVVPAPLGGHVVSHVHSAAWWVVLPASAELLATLLLWLERRRSYPGAPEKGSLRVAGAMLAVFGGTLIAVGLGPAWLTSTAQHGPPAGFPTDAAAEKRVGDGAIELPRGFPAMRIPAENPPTAAKIELGRYLFYDSRLSANGTQSCSSCHIQALAFTDGKTMPTGSTGETLLRNSQPMVNVGYNATLTWANPALTTIEMQVLVPLFSEFPVEMGATGHEQEIMARLAADDTYVRLFAEAFPDDSDRINLHNTVLAVASFLRSLVSGDSSYDRYIGGDANALSDSAKRGMEAFFSERFECHHCHTGFNFTASTVHANSTFSSANFQNTGLYNLDGAGAYPIGNRGVFEITAAPNDMGRFRPPSLRNVEVTAPYMHDGSIATLEEVIRHYARGGRLIESGAYAGDGRSSPIKSRLVTGFDISDQEAADLVAFLESLTDTSFLTNPKYESPFAPAATAGAFE